MWLRVVEQLKCLTVVNDRLFPILHLAQRLRAKENCTRGLNEEHDTSRVAKSECFTVVSDRLIQIFQKPTATSRQMAKWQNAYRRRR